MNCPVCGKKMRVGKVFYQPNCGLHFLPPSGRVLYLISKRLIERQGGVSLDGPNHLGYLESSGTLPAFICESCRKVVVEY